MMGYRKEFDLSATRYPAGWLSKKMIGEPRYTERMRVFHRWCERVMEYYYLQALNDVILEANERERDKVQAQRDFLRKSMEETYKGREIPQSAKGAYEHACKEAVMPQSINENFDPDWMDEELKTFGLYTSELEVVKKWFKLIVDEIAQEEVEELRAKYIESDMEMEIELAIELQKDLEYFNEGR